MTLVERVDGLIGRVDKVISLIVIATLYPRLARNVGLAGVAPTARPLL